MSVQRLVQFTDPHLYGSETETLRGIATLPALTRTLTLAQARDWPVDAVLVTGDLVQDDAAGYAHFRRIFGALNLPILCLPGNHDEPQAMRRALRGKPFVTEGHVDMGAWRVVLLDSTVPNSAHGRLAREELAALDSALSSADTKHTLICLHHHPVSMGSRWLDQVGLENATEFFDVIDRHRNVRAILWGHVHQSYDALRKNVRLLATPSTCAQFLPRADEFAVDARPPAYRTLELHPDGSLLTEVVWVDSSAAGSSSPSSVCSAA
ncbi:MAG TPA: 3',5'-cyclic-AMP phosphodiesterase [Steroidobacteraceae bacterium]|nr:3',5'-cyclic-AMP phosphodiesterase [Steroidobacteraceae bacterium]